MQKVYFEQALRNIAQRDSRFAVGAYVFLKDALDYTVAEHSKKPSSSTHHVTAKELLLGVRDFALNEYGPMAYTLLKEWGVESCSHIGDMVFNLIKEGVFGKQDSDTPEDFTEIYSFHDVFVEPFLPKSHILSTR